jgi:predicted DNA-binding transcriptional regulator AlpA
MENLATGSQEQHPDLGADSVGCASSKTDCHAQPTAPAVIPRLMTDQGVATYLGCSVRTVWRLLEKDPDFPQPIKIGGSTRWDPVEIDCYVDVCKARRPNGR